MINRMNYEDALAKNDPHMHSTRGRVHVLVLHEDAVIAAGLVAILSGHCDLRVVRGSPDYEHDRIGFDVIAASPEAGMRCLDRVACATHTADFKVPSVLFVASEAREADVWRAFSAGASGYLRLGCEPEALAEAVRSVVSGTRYLCPAAARSVAEGISHAALTSREVEVLDLIAVGHSNKLIARGLGIELGTVKAHVKAIFGKLKAGTRTEASAIAIKRGLVGRQPVARSDFMQAGATIAAPLLQRSGM